MAYIIIFVLLIVSIIFIISVLGTYSNEEIEVYQKIPLIKYLWVKNKKTYHKNGYLESETRFFLNFRHGFAVHYYDNGQLFGKCLYLQGKKEGEWQSWYKNGTLKKIMKKTVSG